MISSWILNGIQESWITSERKTSVRLTELPPMENRFWQWSAPRQRSRMEPLPFLSIWQLYCATSHGCNDVLQFHPFLFGKYEFLSLERKNYDEPLFFTSIFGGGRTKSYWIMLFFARKLSIKGGGILSRRLVNCCSMKKWRDKSFTGVRVSPSR